MNKLSLAPSALPYVSLCPCFEQAKNLPYNPKLFIGNALDGELRRVLQFPTEAARTPGIEWAKRLILKKAAGKELFSRNRDCSFVYVHAPSGVEFRGEMDAFTSSQVFELKSGNVHPYYAAQLLPYAAHLFERDTALERVEGHVVFSARRYCQTALFSRHSLEVKLTRILEAWLAPNKVPRPGEACRRCRHLHVHGCGAHG